MYKACQNGFESTIEVLLENNFCLNNPIKYEEIKSNIEAVFTNDIAQRDDFGKLELKRRSSLKQNEVSKRESFLKQCLNLVDCCFYSSLVNGWVGILKKLMDNKAG